MSLTDALVDMQATEAGWPKPDREIYYAPGRRFRADYAWSRHRTLLEIQGGVFMAKSGHSGIAGILRDLERGNHASANGWRLIRLTPGQLKAGELTEWLRAISVNMSRQAA